VPQFDSQHWGEITEHGSELRRFINSGSASPFFSSNSGISLELGIKMTLVLKTIKRRQCPKMKQKRTRHLLTKIVH
jgi:hypothetical protein